MAIFERFYLNTKRLRSFEKISLFSYICRDDA